MIDLKPACCQLGNLLVAVTDEQLTSSTPCTDYTVGDLIEHVDEVAQGFTAVARKDGEQTAPSASPDRTPHLPDGRLHNVAKHVQALAEAWDDPAAWQGSTDTAGVELSNELWGKVAFTKMVVHGWDLAHSTGHPFDLPQETLQACLEHIGRFVPNVPIPELWGSAVEVPTEASLLDQIVAITGRAP